MHMELILVVKSLVSKDSNTYWELYMTNDHESMQ